MALNLDFLRAIGIILVTNSHLDLFYPDSRMALGGGLGNAVFFCLSGYGLAVSSRSVHRGFFEWYFRRIVRIYPSVVIVGGLAVLYFSTWNGFSLFGLLKEFLWPTRHWFISAIVVFYIPFYFFLNAGDARLFYLGSVVLVAPYLIGYFILIDTSIWSIEDGGYFKWVFYAQLMLLGGAAGICFPRVLIPKSIYRDGLLLVFALAAYFYSKYFLSRTNAWHFQMVVHLLTIPVLVFLVRVCINELIQGWMLRPKGVAKVFSFLAMVSLEIYLVQHIPLSNRWLISLGFPGGGAFALLAVLILASSVFYASSSIKSFVVKK